MRFFCVRNKINANFCLFAPILCPCLRIYVLEHVFLTFLKNLKCRHSKAEKGGAKNKKRRVVFFIQKMHFWNPSNTSTVPQKVRSKTKKTRSFLSPLLRCCLQGICEAPGAQKRRSEKVHFWEFPQVRLKSSKKMLKKSDFKKKRCG